MKLTKLTTLLAIGLALIFAATGCKRKTPPVIELGGGSRRGTPPGLSTGGMLPPGGYDPFAIGGGELANFDPDSMRQDRQALAAQTIYFDYDSSSLRSGEQSKVDAVASALNSDLSARLLIEGHCDERGTEEYNRSLGERRALAVREVLAQRGVAPDRVATRSYGEDRPADPGSSPAAWAKNRRAEFVLLHAQ